LVQFLKKTRGLTTPAVVTGFSDTGDAILMQAGHFRTGRLIVIATAGVD
jgi:hypothetical protein